MFMVTSPAEPATEGAGSPGDRDSLPRCCISIDLEASDQNLQRGGDNLHAAAQAASTHVRNVHLTLLSFCAYLAVVFASTTHEQLMSGSPVTLPVLGVDLPLVGIYIVAPFLLILMHFYLLTQAHLLADKLKMLQDYVLEHGGSIERARLDTFPLTQMLSGDEERTWIRDLASLMTWITFAWLPVVLLIFALAKFLPYHSAVITWLHRILLIADLMLLWVIWTTAADLGNKTRRPSWATFWPFGEREPPAHVKGNWRNLVSLTLVTAFSLILFTIPGEPAAWPLDKLTNGLFPKLPWDRNLELEEANFVASWPTQAQIDQFGEELAWRNFGKPINLRDRDLRHGDFRRSVLVRADLRGADLRHADLSYANLQGANFEDAKLSGAKFNCANLEDSIGSNLHDILLTYACREEAGIREDPGLKRVHFHRALKAFRWPSLMSLGSAWSASPEVP